MIPFDELQTIFLDVGNTLVSIDFELVCRELSRHGVPCTVDVLERAEAASRPAVSARMQDGAVAESRDLFRFHLASVLGRLSVNSDRIPELVDALLPVLHLPGDSMRVWSRVLPGVPDALRRLEAAELRLVVVSNSDGSVDGGLRRLGLREHFHTVIDSHVVGVAKPDRRIFQMAIEASGADPARTLHVGDVYAADVVGARAAGIHAMLLDPFDDWGEVDCERIADVARLADRLTGG